jgi:hypothetical protein
VIALALVWGTLGYLALFTVENLALKSLILALALTKTLFISLVKTAR